MRELVQRRQVDGAEFGDGALQRARSRPAACDLLPNAFSALGQCRRASACASASCSANCCSASAAACSLSRMSSIFARAGSSFCSAASRASSAARRSAPRRLEPVARGGERLLGLAARAELPLQRFLDRRPVDRPRVHDVSCASRPRCCAACAASASRAARRARRSGRGSCARRIAASCAARSAVRSALASAGPVSAIQPIPFSFSDTPRVPVPLWLYNPHHNNAPNLLTHVWVKYDFTTVLALRQPGQPLMSICYFDWTVEWVYDFTPPTTYLTAPATNWAPARTPGSAPGKQIGPIRPGPPPHGVLQPYFRTPGTALPPTHPCASQTNPTLVEIR